MDLQAGVKILDRGWHGILLVRGAVNSKIKVG